MLQEVLFQQLPFLRLTTLIQHHSSMFFLTCAMDYALYSPQQNTFKKPTNTQNLPITGGKFTHPETCLLAGNCSMTWNYLG